MLKGCAIHTKLAQTDTTPAVLHTSPGQSRVEVVAPAKCFMRFILWEVDPPLNLIPIQKNSPRFELINQPIENLLRFSMSCNVSPHGSRQAIAGVIHQL